MTDLFRSDSLNNLILVVEDEDSIRKLIKLNLEKSGYMVLEASSGEEALVIFKDDDINIIILDIMLPGMDGFQVCNEIRKNDLQVGIIMLTAKGQDLDKIRGLEEGTDDYMTKPFNPKELVLRVKSLNRRLAKDKGHIIVQGPFKIDKYSMTFYKDGEILDLTPTEYAIIELFIENPSRAFKRDEILNIVWNYEFIGDSKIVDVNIRRLRAKIENDPSNPQYIETVWGLGYRWKLLETKDEK